MYSSYNNSVFNTLTNQFKAMYTYCKIAVSRSHIHIHVISLIPLTSHTLTHNSQYKPNNENSREPILVGILHRMKWKTEDCHKRYRAILLLQTY